MSYHNHICFCGTSTPRGVKHIIGEHGCVRKMVEAPVAVSVKVPPKLGLYGYDPDDRWLADGHDITGHTLFHQRGYYQHAPCGCWSRSPGSDNSIEA